MTNVEDFHLSPSLINQCQAVGDNLFLLRESCNKLIKYKLALKMKAKEIVSNWKKIYLHRKKRVGRRFDEKVK